MNTFAKIRSVPHTVSFNNIFGDNIVSFHFKNRTDFDSILSELQANKTDYVDVSHSDMIVSFDDHQLFN